MTEVLNETDYDIDCAEFAALADYVLTQMHVASDAELNILFIGAGPMEELHVKWLDLPGPTDVMSFPMDELKPGTADNPTPPGMLGDICICPEVATRQAADSGHPPPVGIIILPPHASNPIMGYDHAEDAERAEMFALQRKLLLTFLASR